MLKLSQENKIIDLPDLNRFQIGDEVIVDASADYDRFEGVIIGIELRRMHGSSYLVPSITILHDGCITDEFKPMDCRKVTPPPSSHVPMLDPHAQSLLAAQNNVIDGLMAENEQLRKALAPFAEVADRFDGVPVSAILPQQCWFTPHSLREARAALATTEGKDNG